MRENWKTFKATKMFHLNRYLKLISLWSDLRFYKVVTDRDNFYEFKTFLLVCSFIGWILIWNESIFPGDSIRPEPGFVGSSLKNITVPEGRDVILSCTVKNLGEHKVAWIHLDRSAILTVDKQVITRNARIGVSHEGRHTWNLHIRDVQRSDAGAYMCQINTAKAKTRMGHLSVVGKFISILHLFSFNCGVDWRSIT